MVLSASFKVLPGMEAIHIKSKQMKADFALIFVTLMWGASFIMTKNALVGLETFNFLAIRFGIATLISAVVFYGKIRHMEKRTFLLGIGVGLIMFVAYALQTVGIGITTVSKSAFITGTSVLMVPLFAAWFLKRVPDKSSIFGAILAFFGLGLMTLTGGGDTATVADSINFGDLLTFFSAIGFALHILSVGKFTVQVDSISFAIVQLATVSVFSALTSVVFETPIIPTGAFAWFNILFLAIVCTSLAFIVQNVAQKYTSSTHTALIYAGEPVFAAIFAYIVVGELIGTPGIIGACLIVSGMLFAEINLFERIGKKLKPVEVTK